MIPLRTSIPNQRLPVTTLALLAVNLLVFVWELSLEPAELEAALRTWGLVPARQWAMLRLAPDAVGDWLLPALTSCFLHGGWAHLGGNALFLWVFGSGVEQRLGARRFLVFYLLAGLAAGQVQAVAEAGSRLPMVGASGAIAGCLGGFLLLHPLAMVEVLVPVWFLPITVLVPALLFLGVWFLLQLWFTGLLGLSPLATAAGGVAWWAHAGGFAAGFILILCQLHCLRPRIRTTGDRPPIVRRGLRHPVDDVRFTRRAPPADRC